MGRILIHVDCPTLVQIKFVEDALDVLLTVLCHLQSLDVADAFHAGG